MWSIVSRGEFVPVSTNDTKGYGCFIVKFTSDTYTLPEDVIIYGREL